MKRLDLHGPVPDWFKLSAVFLNNVTFSSTHSAALCGAGSLNILNFSDFVSICNHLSQVDVSVLSVCIDRSLKNLGTINCSADAAAFFENIGLGLGVGVMDLMFSTLAELQAIVLALECVPLSSFVCLFLDSQSALDTCNKNLRVNWHKVKGYSSVLGNECANMIADTTSLLG
ncbi:hypothetical protein G9A89_007205 [Geosiphon pyriformis]|nr:hypothetical protein G9A89_007205 [Geosiphon pyriformis]